MSPRGPSKQELIEENEALYDALEEIRDNLNDLLEPEEEEGEGGQEGKGE